MLYYLYVKQAFTKSYHWLLRYDNPWPYFACRRGLTER